MSVLDRHEAAPADAEDHSQERLAAETPSTPVGLAEEDVQRLIAPYKWVARVSAAVAILATLLAVTANSGLNTVKRDLANRPDSVSVANQIAAASKTADDHLAAATAALVGQITTATTTATEAATKSDAVLAGVEQCQRDLTTLDGRVELAEQTAGSAEANVVTLSANFNAHAEAQHAQEVVPNEAKHDLLDTRLAALETTVPKLTVATDALTLRVERREGWQRLTERGLLWAAAITGIVTGYSER